MSDEIKNNSALNDLEVQASLKNLSASESTESNASIHSSDSLKNIVEAAILAANKAISLDKLLGLFPEKVEAT